MMPAVQAGDSVVVQDVRGRFSSEGEFDLHFHEATDGADTIAWAPAQPWSTGIVGGFDQNRGSRVAGPPDGGRVLASDLTLCLVRAGPCPVAPHQRLYY